MEAVVGLKGVSKLDDFARASSRIDTSLDTAGRLRAGTIGRAKGYVTSSAVRIGTKIRDSAPELDADAVRRALRDTTTSTQQRVTTRITEDVDPDTRRAVTDGGRDGDLVRYLEASDGDDAAEIINKLTDSDGDTADALLQIDDQVTQRRFVQAVSDLDAKALRDADLRGVLDSISSLDRNAQSAAADLIDKAGTTGIRTVNDADDLTGRVEGLTSDEVGDLIVSYNRYQDAEFDGSRSPRAIQDDLNQLAAAKDDGINDGINGLDKMIRGRTGGGNAKNFRGLEGAAQDATQKLEEGVHPDNLYLERDIEIDKHKTARETGLDPDDDLNGKTDVDVDVDDGSATEIKKTDFEPFAKNDFASRIRAGEVSDLWRKLNTVAAYKYSGRITITVSREPDTPFSESVVRKLRNSDDIETGTLDTEEISTLRDIADQVESSSGVDITFKRFDEGN